MTGEELREWVSDYSDECVADEEGKGLLTMEGYDDCIVGVCTQFNRTFVVYDRSKVLAKLVEQGMTLEEAEEFHDFNQSTAWHGDRTPAFIDMPKREDDN